MISDLQNGQMHGVGGGGGGGAGVGWGLVKRALCKTIYSDISSEMILLIIYILCCKHRSSLPSDEVLGQGWICRNYFNSAYRN